LSRRVTQETSATGLPAVLRGLLVTYLLTVLAAVAYATVVATLPQAEKYLPIVARGAVMATAFIGGIISGRRAEKSGWVHGCSVGVLYALSVVLLGAFVSPGTAPFLLVLQRVIVTAVVSAIGGIAGVNL